MSIYNDDRRYGTDEERAEWKREVAWECRMDSRKYWDDDVTTPSQCLYCEVDCDGSIEDCPLGYGGCE